MPIDPEIANILGLKPEDDPDDAVSRIYEWRHRAYRAEKYVSRLLKIPLNDAVKEARSSYEEGSGDDVDVPRFRADLVGRLKRALKAWEDAP